MIKWYVEIWEFKYFEFIKVVYIGSFLFFKRKKNCGVGEVKGMEKLF